MVLQIKYTKITPGIQIWSFSSYENMMYKKDNSSVLTYLSTLEAFERVGITQFL